MRRMSALVATTHIDSEGDRIARSALEDMVEQAKRCYIPVLIGHDPRQPPLGRTVESRVVRLPDGEFGLLTETEIWEPEVDQLEDVVGDGREIPIHDYPLDTWTIVYDRTFSAPEDQALLGEIGLLLGGNDPQLEIKKAVEPLSILTIAGAFILAKVAAKFLEELTSDAYALLKEKVKALIQRRRAEDREVVLRVETVLQVGERRIVVEVFVTNPTPVQIDLLFSHGMDQIRDRIDELLPQAETVGRAVFEYGETERIELRFCVRRDGVPFWPGHNAA